MRFWGKKSEEAPVEVKSLVADTSRRCFAENPTLEGFEGCVRRRFELCRSVERDAGRYLKIIFENCLAGQDEASCNRQLAEEKRKIVEELTARIKQSEE